MAAGSVVDGETIALSDGRTLKLGGIQTPRLENGKAKAWPLAEEARDALVRLLAGHELRLGYERVRADRHGRVVAFLIIDDGASAQAGMVEAGLARVAPTRDARACASELLAAEDRARAARRGIWAEPFYQMRDAVDTAALERLEGSYQIVEGTIVTAAAIRGRIYLNFGDDWHQDFTVTVAPSDVKLFNVGPWAERMADTSALKGVRVRVRGAIGRFNGPDIVVTAPEQIEILSEGKDASHEGGKERARRTNGPGEPPPSPVLRAVRCAVGIFCLAAAAACTTNPATGKSQLATLMSSEDEAQAGAAAHPKILKAYGGAYDDPRLGGYVAGVTSRIVKGSDAPTITYRVTVLNSPVVNAFALPGGYVYVTRGLLALVDDEAELAGVLGHEIGHVIARHSAQRQTAALGASVVGAVLGAVVGSPGMSQAVGQGSQGLLASYSRDQEYEADALGVRYLAHARYDPYAEADFLGAMGEQEKLHATISHQKYDATRVDWLASHPATPDRVAAAKAHAAETGVLPGAGDRNRDVYLHAIDGLIYGDGPDQGIVRGRTFAHPKLRITFTAPPQFTLTNATDAVIIQGPDKTIAKFDGASKAAGMEIGAYLANVWAEDITLTKVERFTVNGMPAATARTKVGDYNARLVAIEASPDTVYRFLMGTLPSAGSRYETQLHELVTSFKRMSAAEAAAVKPLRVHVVRVAATDGVASIAARMDFPDFRVERFRALNGLGASEGLKPGQLVKYVAE